MTSRFALPAFKIKYTTKTRKANPTRNWPYLTVSMILVMDTVRYTEWYRSDASDSVRGVMIVWRTRGKIITYHRELNCIVYVTDTLFRTQQSAGRVIIHLYSIRWRLVLGTFTFHDSVFDPLPGKIHPRVLSLRRLRHSENCKQSSRGTDQFDRET